MAAQPAEAAARKIVAEDARLGRRVHDFRSEKESYHYSNDGSEFASEAAEDQGRKSRRFRFQHQGEPAWVGWGIYFGSLNCQGHDTFTLDIRAEKPCRLEVKAYDTGGRRYTGTFEVGSDWQTLPIPFADLQSNGEGYAAARPIQKIEFQPGTSRAGNALSLGAFRLKPKP
jgi:hypothetical protein